MFKKPYSYPEAIIISGFIVLISFVIEYITQTTILFPKFPVNFYILLGFIVLIIFVHLFLRKSHIIKWLSGKYFSISLISIMALLVLLMGLIPQSDKISNTFISKIGLTNLKNSWTLTIIGIILLVSLGLTILKRLKPFNKKNFAFLLNHLGLWLVVATALVGRSDLMRLEMHVFENKEPVWYAQDSDKFYELPFAIKLEDFILDEYSPKIALVDNNLGEIINRDEMYLIEEGETYQLSEWNIHIDEFIPLSYEVGDKYVEFLNKGGSPSAKITVTDADNKTILTDWLTPGSAYMKSKMIMLNKEYSIALLRPEPKKYSSIVEVFSKDGKKEKATIMVNKPYKIKGWKVYQISYDSEKGRWSELSVLELVRDPWLPFVYVGLIMVLFGALYLFWIGKKHNKKIENDKIENDKIEN